MRKLIEEGGNAVGGRPIQQSEVPEIVEMVNSILDSIGLVFHDDYESCGSAGKKKADKTSGDIDFIVNKKKIIEILNLEPNTPLLQYMDSTNRILSGINSKVKRKFSITKKSTI